MANEETTTEPKRGNRRVFIAIAVVLGLIGGVAAGAFFAGPLLASRSAPAAEGAGAADDVPADAEAGEHAEEDSHGAEEGGGEHEEGGAQPMHVMDNLVLNPARSNGTRFLMVTVAFGVQDEATAAAMGARDPEVRDRVLEALGARTVAELADVSRRDSLKLELRDSVGALFGEGSIRDVYFPQFVIQ